SIFSREEAKTIKSVMEAFGKDKEDYRAIGTFLVFTADKKENLSNSEYRKAAREVDDVAIGRYEQTQKRGNSLKL
ncbi:MAG: mobilization protein, partial [Bacteroides sp]|nr:mobilization protein [Bacteroides sp.]